MNRATRQALCAAYGGGQIKQAQIAGSYPPPPVDIPEIDGSPRADALSAVSGTITGRWTHNKSPFHELYGGKPLKLDEQTTIHPLAEVDYSKIEALMTAWHESIKEKLNEGLQGPTCCDD